MNVSSSEFSLFVGGIPGWTTTAGCGLLMAGTLRQWL